MKMLSSILLIDDDPLTSYLHKRAIEGFKVSHQIEVANNGDEAIQLINQYIQSKSEDKIPQLIFVDLYMPFMDGFQFLEAYQNLEFQNKNSVVVVVLTTSFLQKDKNRIKKYQVKDYVEKPITKEKMMEIMETHFR